jgi:hypothetical protein
MKMCDLINPTHSFTNLLYVVLIQDGYVGLELGKNLQTLKHRLNKKCCRRNIKSDVTEVIVMF